MWITRRKTISGVALGSALGVGGDVSSQRRVQIEWFSVRSGKRSYVRAIARGSDGCDVTHYLHKDGDDIAMTFVKILAQIISQNGNAQGMFIWSYRGKGRF